MRILQDLDFDELKEYIISAGEKSYRAQQIFKGLALGRKITEITDISKNLRENLTENFADEAIKIIDTRTSKKDETVKYLFGLTDGNIIEGVLMKYKYGNTQCVSTQVGCRMGCAFCASGIGGLVRNLTAGEIYSQVTAVNRFSGGTQDKRAVTNIVLMGSGEPLDNYVNVVKFIRLISDEKSLNISPRNISISTCGIVPNILRLSGENLPLNLTISLHNPFDEGRKKLMPIANKYSVKEILDACEVYFNATGRRYIFEYSLVKGSNDDDKCANELIRLLRGRPCHVNLIRLNAVKEKNLLATDDKTAYAFCDKLNQAGISTTVRRQMGADIDGACGQLRRKYLEENND